MSCTQNCNQGRACDCYRANFDHLGQPVSHTPPPWTAPDLLIVLLAVLCIAGLVSGVFK